MNQAAAPAASRGGAAALDGAAVARLMDDFGLDDSAVGALNELGAALRDLAPEALSTARGEGALAGATSAFFLPLLPAAMSEPQKALVHALSRESLERGALCAQPCSALVGEPLHARED